MSQKSRGYIVYVVRCDRCHGPVAIYADGSKAHAEVMHFVGKQLVRIVSKDHDPEVEGFNDEKEL